MELKPKPYGKSPYSGQHASVHLIIQSFYILQAIILFPMTSKYAINHFTDYNAKVPIGVLIIPKILNYLSL